MKKILMLFMVLTPVVAVNHRATPIVAATPAMHDPVARFPIVLRGSHAQNQIFRH